MRRRTALRTAVTGVAAVLAGCGGNPSDDRTPTRTPTSDAVTERTPFDDYGTIVDLVEEGADPTGATSLVPLLEEHAADDTLLYLEEGTFLFDRTFFVEDATKLAIVGDDGRSTIVPERGSTDVLFFLNATDGLRVEGIEFDLTHETTNGRPLQLLADDNLLVRDVSVYGEFSDGSPARFDITDSDGSGVIENLFLPDGATAESRSTGVYVGNRSYGDLTFRGCYIEGFPDNGLYADPPGGNMHVEGGYFANNGISNVRVKGGSTVRDVYIRCDDDKHPEFRNMRGIRATDFEPRPNAPVVVENCRIELIDVTASDGAIVLTPHLVELVVRDTHIHVDADGVNAIRGKPPHPEIRNGERQPTIRCEGVTVCGEAAGNAAIRVDERHGCVFDSLFVHQTGRDRDGIEFRRSNDNVVTDSVLDVRGESIRLVDATADTERIVKSSRHSRQER